VETQDNENDLQQVLSEDYKEPSIVDGGDDDGDNDDEREDANVNQSDNQTQEDHDQDESEDAALNQRDEIDDTPQGGQENMELVQQDSTSQQDVAQNTQQEVDGDASDFIIADSMQEDTQHKEMVNEDVIQEGGEPDTSTPLFESDATDEDSINNLPSVEMTDNNDEYELGENAATMDDMAMGEADEQNQQQQQQQDQQDGKKEIVYVPVEQLVEIPDEDTTALANESAQFM